MLALGHGGDPQPRVLQHRGGVLLPRGQLFLSLLEPFDQRGDIAFVLRQARFSAIHHRFGKPQASRDRNAVRAAGDSFDEAIRWGKRDRVELKRRIHDPTHLPGQLLERAEVPHGVIAPFQQSNAALQTQVSDLLHPTPTIIPDPVTIIQDVRALARLETIQYSVEKVITAEIGQGNFGFLFGDRLLFVAHGVVIAGIDMDKLQPGDMQMVNGVLNVRLPPAEIFIANLNNDKSYVYDRNTGLLTKGDQNLETTARQAAEDEIKKAAVEDGILNQAQINAESYLSKFFGALGFPNPVFVK